MRFLILLSGIFILPMFLSAQIFPVSLDDRIDEATLIVEAEVIDSYSFWDATHSNIYTSNLLRVYKVFQGTFAGDEIELITEGGMVGLEGQHNSHMLSVSVGEVGLFCCKASPVTNSGRTVSSGLRMQAVAAEQGFIRYDDAGNTAKDPFESYRGISTVLYNRVQRITGQSFRAISARTVTPPPSLKKGGGFGVQLTPSITSLSGPHAAGVKATLTIEGSDFGSTQGVVRFKSADDGGVNYITAISSEYVSWSDTEIKVYVPARAGTGKVKVVTSTNDSTVSTDLIIPYSQLNVVYLGNTYQPDHVNDNGYGGYTWRMSTNFTNTTARKSSFLTALATWRDAINLLTNRVNWDVGPDTSLTTIALDGTNLAAMSSTLPSGVLGSCTSRWSGYNCPPITWYLAELDIVFNQNFNWAYNGYPLPTQYDFQTVALHELGHGMQMGHANNTAQVMYYALSAGQTKHTPHANDIAGAEDVMLQSVTANTCGPGPITAVSANASADVITCGGSTMLSARGGLTYEWTIPSVSTTVLSTEPQYTVAPAATTTYRATITNGSCYSTTDDVTVTIATPSADAGTDVGICPAGSAIIGSTGASTSNCDIGTSVGYGTFIMYTTGSRDNRAQLLFHASELSAAGMSAGAISRIAFSISTANTATQAMNNFNVRMALTDDTTMQLGFTSSTLTTVYSAASYTPSGTGWQDLTLAPGFAWDGSSNLIVDVCFDNTSKSTSYRLDYCLNPGYRSAYRSGNGSGCSFTSQYISQYRPLTQFTIGSEGYAWSPTTNLSSAYVANPTASPSSTTTYTLTVTNGYGCTDNDAVTVTVHPADPTSLTWTGAFNSNWSTLGNWDNPCATPTTGDVVTIPSGTTPPTNNPALTLSSLTIDNSSGMTLANDLSVTGTLTLTSGNLTLGSSDMTLTSTGTISGGGSSTYVVTNSSGALVQQDIGSSGRTGTISFPVGTASSYTPVQLQNSGTADAFDMRVQNSVLDGGSSGTPLTTHAVDRSWFINEGSAGGSNATLTLQWNSGDELSSFDRTNCFVAHHDGSSWSALQSAGAASGSDPYTRTAIGVTSFSPFSIGDVNSPLPVELVAFHAHVRDGRVILSWTTATELNNYGFAVERTGEETGKWTEIGFVRGHGTSSSTKHYSFSDADLSGETKLRYRLRQMDRDGSIEYSTELVVSLNPPRGIEVSRIYPQPATGSATMRLTLDRQQPVSIRLYNFAGQNLRTVHDGTLTDGSHAFTISTVGLPSGQYYLVVIGSETLKAVPFVVYR